MRREVELINETEIFTEALVASVALGEITVDQLKRQLEGGLAYVATQDADDVEEELLIALAALDKAIWRVTGSVCSIGGNCFPAADVPSAAAPATSPRSAPEEADQADLRWQPCNQTPISVGAHRRGEAIS
jgi:hypothetical protein